MLTSLRGRNLLSLDDGILANSENEHSRGSYASMTVPRALREVIYSKNEDGSSNYGADTFDLIKLNGIEVPSQNHSPIIGWAYDGYPIYGPYGYSDIQGGSIKALETGYELDPPLGRPDGFPQGFFIEDYLFKDNGDLDEHNGRFAKLLIIQTELMHIMQLLILENLPVLVLLKIIKNLNSHILLEIRIKQNLMSLTLLD